MQTEPKKRFPKDYPIDPNTLTAGRYGTLEMVNIWGPEKTFEDILYVQAEAASLLAELYPDIVSLAEAREISEKANLKNISPARIREFEAKSRHDIIAINTALEEVVSKGAGSKINLAKTSADSTQPARALQLKRSMEVVADSVENLRDIVLEKSMEWINVPHMDTTHLYDALPTVAGRPLAFYGEMLQSGLEVLKFFYNHSIKGKWADVTGNHHGAVTLGINGRNLQAEYCKRLGVGWMDAPAQLPGLEFEADIFYTLARLGETVNNLAKYIAWGRGDDVNIFINKRPSRSKGSSGMPHKDAKNGNPTDEEQFMSERNYGIGNLVTGLINCDFSYARNLAASANGRINFEDGFKFFDHAIRQTADITYWVALKEQRSVERVTRSLGVVTSPQVMTYLVDKRRVENPMTRSEAHDLVGKIADEAWNNNLPFIDMLLKNNEVTSRLSEETLRKITDPIEYIGESKLIIETVHSKYYGEKTLGGK